MIRCVVFDDEPLILRSIVRKIQNLNPEFKVVATAMDGQEGCRVIKEYRPDVIFTDICMPIMDGLEIIAKVREEKVPARCVILSGYREFEYAKRALKYGVKDYLLKPLDNQRLGVLLKELSEEIGQKRAQEKRKLLEGIKYRIPGQMTMAEADNLFFDAEKSVLFECKLRTGSYPAGRIIPGRINCSAGPVPDYETVCRKVSKDEKCEIFLFYGPDQNEASIYVLTEKENNHNDIAKQLYEAVKRQLKENTDITCAVSQTITGLGGFDRIESETDCMLHNNQPFAASSVIYSSQEGQKLIIGDQGSEDIIKKIDDYISRHYREPIRVQDIAQKFSFNYSYLSTAFRKFKGISPNEYIIEKRMEEAKFLLKAYPEMTVKEIAEKVGYVDSLYFSRIFKKVTGYSPADYKHHEEKG